MSNPFITVCTHVYLAYLQKIGLFHPSAFSVVSCLQPLVGSLIKTIFFPTVSLEGAVALLCPTRASWVT